MRKIRKTKIKGVVHLLTLVLFHTLVNLFILIWIDYWVNSSFKFSLVCSLNQSVLLLKHIAKLKAENFVVWVG